MKASSLRNLITFNFKNFPEQKLSVAKQSNYCFYEILVHLPCLLTALHF